LDRCHRAVSIYLAYNFYARRIDRDVIQSDAKRATPARMYMDGVDFMPTSRNVLYGYHFKSIAAAGPIVGPITAANLWGWLPALLWLVIGVSFIGWVSDYSAIMVSIRNDGNSLSAISHRLIAPRTRSVLFVFIFFYLLLIAGAFIGILAAILSARPDVPFGIFMLALMGLAAGYMMYRLKMDLVVVTVIVVAITIAAMVLGPFGQQTVEGKLVQGPVGQAVVGLNSAIDRLSGGQALLAVTDPTNADPRIPVPGADGKRPTTALYDAETGLIKTMPNYLLWVLFLFVFSYLGANLAIWRFAQPVNYIGFWLTLITIGLSAIGAVLAPITGATTTVADQTVRIADFALQANKGLGRLDPTKAWQPVAYVVRNHRLRLHLRLHALFGSVGTARQLEYETDGLPVGSGAMFTEVRWRCSRWSLYRSLV
jgi:carbon starvation protein